MKKSGFLELMRQSEETLCFIFTLMLAAIYPFFLSHGYMKAGTDKGVLYIYISGAFCLFGITLFILYFLGKIKERGLAAGFAKPTVSDIFMIIYLIIINVSFFFSYNKRVAIVGEGGWYQGYLTSVFLVLSYFLISRFMRRAGAITVIFCIVSGIEFILGSLNRMGIYPIPYEGAESGFISTLGNINWFCGFWAVFFALAAGLFFREEGTIKKILLGILLAIGSVTGALQGSDSALVVYTVVILVAFYKSVDEDMESRVRSMVLACIILGPMTLAYLFFKTISVSLDYDSFTITLLLYSPVPLILFVVAAAIAVMAYVFGEDGSAVLFKVLRTVSIVVIGAVFCFYLLILLVRTGNPEAFSFIPKESPFLPNYEWGNSRGYTWVAGIKAYFDGGVIQKLVGWGPDSLAYAVYRGGSSVAGFVTDKFGEARLTNAHNEWITVLVNYGFLGMVAFMGAQISKAKELLKGNNGLSFACGMALVSYMAHNFFSFAQPVNIPYIFILMGLGTWALQSKNAETVDF
ncbi:MAG: O-antigen ligase family protein [Lachnospiraceae bacterium]|nr:O-antigen ligase family protein [Lachnospiraceae bacterium]